MPRVENEIKLDFKDVLIRPKRSTLKSRADVDISRHVTFRHSKKHFPDDMVPVLAANMDTVGTFEMALVLSSYIIYCNTHDIRIYIFLNLKCLFMVVPVPRGKTSRSFSSLLAFPHLKNVLSHYFNKYS